MSLETLVQEQAECLNSCKDMIKELRDTVHTLQHQLAASNAKAATDAQVVAKVQVCGHKCSLYLDNMLKTMQVALMSRLSSNMGTMQHFCWRGMFVTINVCDTAMQHALCEHKFHT